MNRIFIDAVNPENVQIAHVKGGKMVSFARESKGKNDIKGNVYLATVVRVEPSLQAVFINYGDQKNGFIPFDEIDPCYWKKPKEDAVSNQEDTDESQAQRTATQKPRRNYKVQEVIRRNQILLVQSFKEERGNKSAAFTTFISLAGRYCVLTPNKNAKTAISKRIDSEEERERLAGIVEKITHGSEYSNVILRTSAEDRSEAEIESDYSALARIWNLIREQTLSSTAPAFIYADDDLIRRIVRDMRDSHPTEMIVQGEEMYEHAMSLIQSLPGSENITVRPCTISKPIFEKYGINEQINKLYDPVVRMHSGAYIVINVTEALVSIDVNSGSATSEKNVESTALKTNLEAAKEIAHQLKLRELSGLIVIDFIDMYSMKNKKQVELAMKQYLASDHAKTQIGMISRFGLLELSRQRTRSSFLESAASHCSHCSGVGFVKSSDFIASTILKKLRYELVSKKGHNVAVATSVTTALYLLNYYRDEIVTLENILNVRITVQSKPHLSDSEFEINTTASARDHHKLAQIKQSDIVEYPVVQEEEREQGEESPSQTAAPERKKRRRVVASKQPGPVETSTPLQAEQRKNSPRSPKIRRGQGPKKEIVEQDG